jgi:hypothetical protein
MSDKEKIKELENRNDILLKCKLDLINERTELNISLSKEKDKFIDISNKYREDKDKLQKDYEHLASKYNELVRKYIKYCPIHKVDLQHLTMGQLTNYKLTDNFQIAEQLLNLYNRIK